MNLQTVSYFLDKPVFLLTEKCQINHIARRFVTGWIQVQTIAVGRVGSTTNESVNLASGLHKMFAMTAWRISAHNKNESLFEQIYESQSPVNQDVFEVGLPTRFELRGFVPHFLKRQLKPSNATRILSGMRNPPA